MTAEPLPQPAVRRGFAPGSRGFIVLLGAITALTALSVDMSLPALPELTRTFATTADTAQLTLSLFLVGFAATQLVYGPLSDRFGRRPVLLAGVALYAAAGLGCALSASIEALILFRLVQGMGAAVGRTLGPAIVRDHFRQPKSAQMLSYVTLVMALAPLVAPVIGAWLVDIAGWQAVFFALAASGAALFAAAFLRFGESLRRPDYNATKPATLLGNYAHFLGERDCIGFALVNCCVFAAMFSYISNSPFVLIEVFGLERQAYGFLFGLTAVAFMAGSVANSRLLPRLTGRRVLEAGFALLVVSAVALLSITLLGRAGPFPLVGAMMVFFFGVGLVVPNATAAAMEPMPHMAGVASSLLGCTQMASGSVVGYVVSRLYDRSPLPMAISIAAMSTLGALLYLALLRRPRT